MEKFVIIAGKPLLVWDSGKGEQVLVLLHGYLETLYIFDALIKQMSAPLRIIRMDLPGHGLSEAELPVNTIEHSASVVHDYLESQGIEKAFIAGHSMGSYIAQAFAKAYPEMTAGLIIMHGTAFADSPFKKADRDKDIAAIEEGHIEELARECVPLMYAPGNRKKKEGHIDEVIEWSQVHDPQGIIACLRGMQQRPSYEEFLSGSELPMLFFFGDEDYYIPMDKAHAMAAACPQAMSIYLKHCGHNGFVEEPKQVAVALESFIEAITRENC